MFGDKEMRFWFGFSSFKKQFSFFAKFRHQKKATLRYCGVEKFSEGRVGNYTSHARRRACNCDANLRWRCGAEEEAGPRNLLARCKHFKCAARVVCRD
jgi:hypothetical protein